VRRGDEEAVRREHERRAAAGAAPAAQRLPRTWRHTRRFLDRRREVTSDRRDDARVGVERFAAGLDIASLRLAVSALEGL